ncbi:protein kinase, ABC-1 [Guillardia theta CCMP2712]|uniref:Protein kinase, ABC-1 n=1 Tax=Guillardia theta (strain CCMP2712) TaxID=905079 RepID=L1I7Z6_GUITC|nr:protein kinase, ABC-1 [Guillardia theta CCMP2712]EKX31985.1 protein kinase, ABC-1 [Guillardia theta CCMP2712]|eukprot:XP_005818965.1 protein kinase, ABC-1 [Guillardia theta CCMP2712]
MRAALKLISLALPLELVFSFSGSFGWRPSLPSQRSRAARSSLLMVQSPPRTSVRSLSNAAADARKQMEQDERVRILMEGMRGTSLNQDDFAQEGQTIQVVQFDSGNELPLTYEPDLLKDYYRKRPGIVLARLVQVMTAASGFFLPLVLDAITGNIEKNDVIRTRKLREILTSLGPFFIKLGQALAIRPDILSPQAMYELQRLCDKVPAFDNDLAMRTMESELGVRVTDVFSELSPQPIAAASLGQVYRGVLRKDGATVAVKVQRPFVLETVSLDLYLMREAAQLADSLKLGRTDFLALLDEFAPRFYGELDYVLECKNGEYFQEIMQNISQVVVPRVYPEFTTRRVHVAEWIEGVKLSQSESDDVEELVAVGMIAYLTQLLESGFFHADPHPGNMLRTPEGKLAILDFGLMTQVTDDQKYGMIEAIAHLLNRDYEEIIQDFVSLDFIPPETDVEELKKDLLPALKNLAGDLAQITFKFPFKIPPYFALVIRAIGVLEGIALVGNPQFALIDEAFPYLSKRLLTDDAPRLRSALRYMVYGKGSSFDVDRLIELLQAFQTFVDVRDSGTAGRKEEGERGGEPPLLLRSPALTPVAGARSRVRRRSASMLPPAQQEGSSGGGRKGKKSGVQEALVFFFSDSGSFLRQFILDETVNSVDAMSRGAALQLLQRLSLDRNPLLPPPPPIFRSLLPPLSEQDEKLISNADKLLTFLGAPRGGGGGGGSLLEGLASSGLDPSEIASLLPQIAPGMRQFALQIVGGLLERLNSRLVLGMRQQAQPVVSRYFRE